MTTDYQKRIMTMAGIEFEDVQDTDILTFDYPHEYGGVVKCWFYLYYPNGRIKQIMAGNAIHPSERLFGRPMLRLAKEREEAEELMEEEDNVPNVPEPIVVRGKKEKGKRNLSPEERGKRAVRMKEVAMKYWAEKRAKEANG